MGYTSQLCRTSSENDQQWAETIYDLALAELAACSMHTRRPDVFSTANSYAFQAELSKCLAVVLMRRGDYNFIDYRQLLPN